MVEEKALKRIETIITSYQQWLTIDMSDHEKYMRYKEMTEEIMSFICDTLYKP